MLLAESPIYAQQDSASDIAADGVSASNNAAELDRVIGVRLRPDIQFHPQFFGRTDQWGIKDPVTLEYFHFTDQEVALLRMLDGKTSVRDIQSRYERQFAPEQLSADEIRVFVGQLYRDGLVIVEAAGQGTALYDRRQTNRRRKRRQALLNPLAFRIRGVDPHRFIDWLHDAVFWAFSPWFLTACLLVITSAVTLAIVRFESLITKLPTFHEFISTDNLILLALVLAIVKTLHELGHALACRHFGGECHELGILFLVFTPCLYCNVSDSWLLPSRWQRVLVSLAGMFVELTLAAICTFLWWFSEPGLLNSICLQVMFVCSVATLLFNGNPLLRYDAYYVLSDVSGVPNLAGQARAQVSGHVRGLWIGDEEYSQPAHPKRRFLLTYGVASAVYRWFVLAAILWFIHQVAVSHRLEVLARVLAIVVVAGVLIMPTTQAVNAVAKAAIKRKLRFRRFLVATGIFTGAIAVLLMTPMPYHIKAAGVVDSAEFENIYIPVDGVLVRTVRAGTRVTAGQTIAKLDSDALRFEILKLDAELRERELHIKTLIARQSRDPRIEGLVPVAEQQRDDTKEQLDQRCAELELLRIKAPRSGVVQSPPWRPVKTHPDSLSTWNGSPLDTKNKNCFLERGTLLCQISSDRSLEATLVVRQSDVEFLSLGQTVSLMLDQSVDEPVRGTITSISEGNLKTAPMPLAATGRIPIQLAENGLLKPAEASYAVKVQLDVPADKSVTLRSVGIAKIEVEPRPMWTRLHRYIRRTFRFDLD